MHSGNREKWIDAVKVIALALVFALHTQRGVEVTDPCGNFVFFYAARCAMPLFFMVNGALIMRRDEFGFVYWKRKVFNAFRVLAVWGGVTFFYYLIVQGVGFIEAAKNGVKAAIAYHWVVNLWFLITFVLLYTILLFFFDFVKKNRKTLLIILGIVCICVEFVSVVRVDGGGFFIQEYVNQRFRLWTWAFYFLLGSELSEIDTNRFGRPFLIFFSAIMTIVCVAVQYRECWLMTGQIESNYMHDSPLIMLWSASIFLLIRSGGKVSDFIAKVAGPSFGAFLLHSYFIDAFALRAVASDPIRAFAVWLLLLCGCWILSYLLGKIPVIRRMLTY